jgi:antitoxin ParD1/3/4
MESGAMAKNTSVIIGDHFAEFIERQVGEGRYGSASDVVRAGLRLLEEREMKIDALRAALVEGEQSGASTAFDFDAFIKRKRRKGRRGEKSAT